MNFVVTSDNARIYGQVETVFGAIRNVNCIYEFMTEKGNHS